LFKQTVPLIQKVIPKQAKEENQGGNS